MNRVDFGRLIASLRREHEDEYDRPWSQEKLAQEANAALEAELFSERVVGNIERGERSLDSQTLLALAGALQLTSGERKEFFLAASGIDSDKIPRQQNNPNEVLSQLVDRIKQVYLPAYVIDSYCDVVAANMAIMKLLDFEAAGLSPVDLAARSFGSNVLQYVFLDEAVRHFSRLMGEDWADYAYHHMMLFRTFSLRYRSTEYFQELLRHLKKYREFRRYWRGVYFEEKDHFVDNEHIHMNSPKWGHLVWVSTSLTALTTAGELHFCVYVPANRETANAFAGLVDEAGVASVFRVGSWPQKALS